MKLPRRHFLRLAAGAAALPIVPAPAWALDYPTRPVRVIVGFPAGIGPDITGRLMSQWLSDHLGQQFIVDNRPGASSNIATEMAAKAAPDGYTLLITSGAHIANAFTVKKLPYDVLKDFAPVTQLAASYGLALITNLPVKSVADLVALAKKKPGQLTFATNGVGNVTHVAGLLFDARTGVKMIAVPYNTPNLITDVMTGQVDMAFYSVAAAAPLVKAGKIKALALTGSRRAPALPDTPTLQGLGYKDFDVTGYFGLLFPAGTPHERIDAIYRVSKDALSSPQLKRVLDVSGMYPVGSSPEEFAAFLKQDYAYQDKLMSELGLKVK